MPKSPSPARQEKPEQPHKKTSATGGRQATLRLADLLKAALGTAAGLILLEAVLRANPGLMLRGIPLLAPLDPPVMTQRYDFRVTDGDAYYWNRVQIAPVSPEEDIVVAQVRFETDEFGFPNAAPAPERADVVVLGRSYSLGAQAEVPWARVLAERTGMHVLNLSQAGNSIEAKLDFLNRFAAPRHPRWVIVEILPTEDVYGFRPSPSLLIQRVAFPALQSILRQAYNFDELPPDPAQVIYPIKASAGGQPIDLIFFLPDLEAMTIDAESLGRSADWQRYSEALLALNAEAKQRGMCVALMYTTTKPEVVLPLIDDMAPLMPLLSQARAWRLGSDGTLILDAPLDISRLQSGENTPRAFVRQFAEAHGMTWIDPGPAFTQAIREGQQPFLTYDTHWTALGHRLVADTVESAIREANCG